MAAQRAYDQCQHCTVILVTHEAAPLELFGPDASRDLSSRLDEAGIAIRTGARARIRRPGELQFDRHAEPLHVDRIVTLPVVDGPAVAGLPHDARGFLPVDQHGRIHGVPDVYAAGDVTHYPVKQGGLACQQADAAAEAIAAQAGVAIKPTPYTATLQGVLLTGRGATVLPHVGTADDEVPSVAEAALWWPPTKIAGRELASHIAQLRDPVASIRTDAASTGRRVVGA
jgi:sulfide:quinone oxidoreductase